MLGTFIIISGLSGAGKTVAVARSIKRCANSARVITCTTRTPRAGEVDGTDYRFFTHTVFARKLAQGEFAEHAEVYGNYYGTLREDIDAAREHHTIAFLVTDVQGVKTLRVAYPDARSVWIDMDREEFVARLEKRGESPENITVRMAKIDKELAERTLFDKIIANKMGRLDNTVRSLLRYVARCHRDDTLAQHLRSLSVAPKHAP